MDAIRLSRFGFVKQLQLSRLIALQQRNHDVDASPPPAAYFILKPFPSSWTGNDRKPSTPWTSDPKEVRVHDSFFIIFQGGADAIVRAGPLVRPDYHTRERADGGVGRGPGDRPTRL